MGKLLFTTLFLLYLAITPAQAGPDGVGLVKVIHGLADVVRGETVTRLTLGSSIHQGDTIRTSGVASVGITFQDESTLALGPNSEITIDEFVFDPAANTLGFMTSLTLGIVTYTSGEIAKLRPEAVTVRTPLATIGIRGTRFAAKVDTP